MSKRFGRNQKRRLQAELTTARMNAIKAGEVVQLVEQRRAREVESLWADIKAARMARDTIRITVDDLLDPRDERIQVRARLDFLGTRNEPIWAAQDMDFRGIAMHRNEAERRAFTKLFGEAMADYALAAIMRHWRSR